MSCCRCCKRRARRRAALPVEAQSFGAWRFPSREAAQSIARHRMASPSRKKGRELTLPADPCTISEGRKLLLICGTPAIPGGRLEAALHRHCPLARARRLAMDVTRERSQVEQCHVV